MNRELVRLFQRIARLLELRGEDPFKIRAYRRAAEALANLDVDAHLLWEQGRLTEVPGIGQAIAKKIDEYYRTGRLGFLERLEAEVPPSLLDLLRLPGLGPKKVRLLWQELGITSLSELEHALRQGRVRAVKGFSARSETRLLAALQALPAGSHHLLGDLLPVGETLLSWLREEPAVTRAELTGAVRRGCETAPHLEILVATPQPKTLLQALTAHPALTLEAPSAHPVPLRWRDGTPVRLYLCPPQHFAWYWLLTTGSPAHLEALAPLAARHGWRLTLETAQPLPDEQTFYAQLGLPFIPPTLREGRGEVQAAQAQALPSLLQIAHLVADLHTHSTWSDGRASIRAMAEAALARGLRVLAITDHSQGLHVAGGLDPDALRRQRAVIRAVQDELGQQIVLLQGAEVEILPDGSLDYPDEVLAELDIVVASLHTHLRQPAEEVTARLLRAISHPLVDLIAHPTGRLLPHRPPAALDFERVFAAAAAHGTALEINANPHRLDLRDEHIHQAQRHGVLLALNTDAHRTSELDLRRYGVLTAQRGWATPERVLNTWAPERLLTWLRTPKAQRRA